MAKQPDFTSKEHTVEVILRWKEPLKHRQTKLYEIHICNEQEFHDFKDGLYRARNNVLQGRT